MICERNYFINFAHMNSFLNKAFGFDPHTHKKSKEITAGITTFLTMSYILAPRIRKAMKIYFKK